MLDFWESMGRVVADENGLRQRLLSEEILTAPNTPILDELATGASRRVGWFIGTPKYDKLRTILSEELRFLPVSLICLGEWLRVLSGASDSDFTPLPRSTPVVLKGRNPFFYAALGAITIDASFVAKFASDPAKAFPLSTGNLSQKDVDDLRSIATDTAVGSYNDNALTLCIKHWPPPCIVLIDAYSANLDQTHPSLDTTGAATAVGQ